MINSLLVLSSEEPSLQTVSLCIFIMIIIFSYIVPAAGLNFYGLPAFNVCLLVSLTQNSNVGKSS